MRVTFHAHGEIGRYHSYRKGSNNLEPSLEQEQRRWRGLTNSCRLVAQKTADSEGKKKRRLHGLVLKTKTWCIVR